MGGRRAVLAVVLAAVLAPAPALADAPPTDVTTATDRLFDAAQTAQATGSSTVDRTSEKLAELFREVLRDPGNVALNLEYAQLAESLGELERAIAAFERVLAANPGNAEAEAGIARIRAEIARLQREQEVGTKYSLALSAHYESNAAHRDPSFLAFDSSVFAAVFGVRDERLIDDTRLRTNALVYGDIHNRFDVGDVLFGGIDSGPVMILDDEWRMRPGVGISHARLDKRPLYTSGYLLANFERRVQDAVIRGVDGKFGYQEYGDRFNGRDGLFLDTEMSAAWADVLAPGDSLGLKPGYLYNHATGLAGANRYHRLRAKGSYLYPFSDRVVLGGDLTVSTRFYEGSSADESDNRRDFLVIPGAKVVLPNLVYADGSLIIDYLFERNWSNDGDKTFRNHRIGATVGWTF